MGLFQPGWLGKLAWSLAPLADNMQLYSFSNGSLNSVRLL